MRKIDDYEVVDETGDEQVCAEEYAGWYCTRIDKHKGDHVAHDGSRECFRWNFDVQDGQVLERNS